MTFPSTLLELHARFPDEEACWTFLRRARWPRGFRCPRCDHRHGYALEGRRLEQCARCRYQASLTAGTVFHGTRVPLRVWFLAIFFLGRHKQSISALQLQRDAGLGSYRTAWLLLHKLRSTLASDPARLLSGLVEADETYLGAPHEKGRAGGRTTVRTDGLWSYRPLARVGVRHEYTVQDRRDRAPTLLPWSLTVFAHLRAWLRGTFRGASAKQLPSYLEEFAYRFNRRSDQLRLAGSIVERALVHAPLPYGRLVAEGSA